MTDVRDEIILPLRTHPQPQPSIVSGGDCAACCFAGLCGIRPDKVYERIFEGEAEAPSRVETEGFLHTARQLGLIRRFVTDVPTWPVPDYYMAFGPSGYVNFDKWFNYLWMAMEGGYYGLASVVFDKTGPEGKIPPDTDHVVLLCGAREVEVPHPTLPSSRIVSEVLVSCSAKSSPKEEWVPVREFLSQRGGYNVILVKP
jgi:hypothetical protein